MATSRRRKFSAQFKAQAVQMVVQNDRPIAQVAKELHINDGTPGNWVKLYREENPEPEPALMPSDRLRLAELEAEVRELRMGNEFLKKPQPSSPRSRVKRLVSPDFSSRRRTIPLPGCAANWALPDPRFMPSRPGPAPSLPPKPAGRRSNLKSAGSSPSSGVLVVAVGLPLY